MQAEIDDFSCEPVERIEGCHDGDRSVQARAGQGVPVVRRAHASQVDGQAGLGEVEETVGVWPPRRMHRCYMFSTIASANSLVRRRVAPSISR